MFNNELIVKSIARRVFPGMGKFSYGVAKLNVWDVYLSVTDEVTWLTVKLGLDVLFQIEAQDGYVVARYALPAVVELGDGEKTYGTMWANSHRWHVDGWSSIPSVAADIRKFFNNDEEFYREEAEVYKILEGQGN